MIPEIIGESLIITGFVGVIMLVIEYLNVATRGNWQQAFARRGWTQYVLAGVLGATPGCLGAFAVVGMYFHRVLGLGAVVTAMIATSGDESYVMFALIPRQALLITLTLLVLGVVAGVLTDLVLRNRKLGQLELCDGLEIHEEEAGRIFPRGQILRQWKTCTAARGILSVVLILFIAALAMGKIGSGEWDWIRISLMAVSAAALFMVATSPDHFLEEHLWKHVALRHVPKIFLWVLGAMLLIQLFTENLNLGEFIRQGKWLLLALACLVGLIPESGPNLIFLTLYVKGTIPVSILLASSIVQDGHGMLPMLAHSRRGFVVIKAINFAVGLFCGALLMAFGH